MSQANTTNENLYKIVEGILSLLGDDEITSINDTSRSYDVTKIVERSYKDFLLLEDLPENGTLIQLDAVSNSDYPTTLRIPDNVGSIKEVRYQVDKQDGSSGFYRTMRYLKPLEFTNMIFNRNSSTSNSKIVKVLSGQTPEEESPSIVVYTDRSPSYWTTFDDEHITFDSYDSDVEDTIANAKTAIFARMNPVFTYSDTFVMPVDPNTQRYIIARATNLAFSVYKGYVPTELARTERKIKSRLNSAKTRFEQEPDWYAVGRK